MSGELAHVIKEGFQRRAHRLMSLGVIHTTTGLVDTQGIAVQDSM